MSVTDEMATVIVSTAYSPLVRDVLDFTVALCNLRGEMVVQGVGMAIHLGALAQAAPHLVRAASEGGTTRYTFAATVDGKPGILSEALVGAWGGHSRLDGVDGVANIAANMSNSPVEMVESTYPVMVEEYGHEPDSEGAGRHRGGLGVRRRIRVLAPARMNAYD